MEFLKSLNTIVEDAFEKAGFDRSYGKTNVSNRPDLCEYQCNGAMASAKQYHQAPIKIAEAVVENLKENPAFSMAEAVMPGFINLNVSEQYLCNFVSDMAHERYYGIELPKRSTVIVDYGGPNVAKPLHIGHLRPAIIGESVKRILKFMGQDAIGDIHLGDWGLQFGLIIEELKARKPELCYFDPNYTGEYPEEAPFTLSELEEIYPYASAKSKEDEAYLAAAHENTFKLQHGDRAYEAIWKHIANVSIPDLKRNYDNLDVYFDLWKGESDAKPFIPELVERLDKEGLTYVSNGATVVDVMEESDTREVPPCLIMKSDGAYLYQTTDLATIIDRMQSYQPSEMIYITDKRQELHFTQVFRVAKKAHLVNEDTKLVHIGFGTMNGKDGKPFKTRSGGVMRLEYLINEINSAVYEKMKERYGEDELDEETVKTVGLAALKYGDLSNQAQKDYNFDIDRFASFEGNTGPYILYTIVRIKSILRKAEIDSEYDFNVNFDALPENDVNVKAVLKILCEFPEMMETVYAELAPHKICSYIFRLSDAFNSFYHDTQILKEVDEEKRHAYLSLSLFTKRVLEVCIHLLGFSAPEKM